LIPNAIRRLGGNREIRGRNGIDGSKEGLVRREGG
jgi:hypothetical protein